VGSDRTQTLSVEGTTELEEVLEAALRGLFELVAKYSPEESPNGERYLPANGGHSIERELRIAKSALDDSAIERSASEPALSNEDRAGLEEIAKFLNTHYRPVEADFLRDLASRELRG
jgi:hypothetical protein